MSNFIHLRCHTNYSIAKGSLEIDNLCTLCKKYRIPAVAITDSYNIFGGREFSVKTSSKGIKPIIGLELEVQYTEGDKNIIGILVILAMNKDGYKNILKLHDISYANKSNNNYDNPRVSFADLEANNTNLILLSGGSNGLLAKVLNTHRGNNFIEKLQSTFNDRLYIEINRLFQSEDLLLEPKFLELAKSYKIPIVATNNVFFAEKEDFEASDILFCIGQGVTEDTQNRERSLPHSYFKSPEEMLNLFKDLPEAIENTIKIAKRCNFYIEAQPPSLPKFSDDEDNLIIKEAKEGLQKRLEQEVYKRNTQKTHEEINKIYFERLDFELKVIIEMGFSGYFLIVADFIAWAKNNNIPTGPGRGSGAGSLVAWVLGIVDVNPIQFGLLFERFLNPQRISMPDFDIDFCQDRRDDVIEYVRQKYGKDKVAHIITFGTLQTKAALKDVGRAKGMPYAMVDAICKKIPFSPPSNPINLAKIIADEEGIKDEIQNNANVKHLFDIALKLEGLYRNISTHAAGIVISKDPLNEVIPLYYDVGSNFPSVGFSMKYLEDTGLIKFDFLALTTLTIIQNTLNQIKATEGKEISILEIPYVDTGISDLLSKGDCLGIFQLESRGMIEAIKQMKPDKIEDIIAMISLYRPGPMENIPTYINVKHGREKLIYLHPKMQSILDETFGIMIYQEQVMEVARIIAGYTLASADILRRAMGKKDPQEMKLQRSIFIQGAKEHNQIQEKLASQIFDQMEKFAGYGFNKSHATAYALISWQTAYLKAYYPAEFLSSVMSADINSNNKDIQKFLEYVENAKTIGLTILPPSINYPSSVFEIENKDGIKSIRYCLLALKGVGISLVAFLKADILKNGHYTSLKDFLSRVDNKLLNRKQLEALIKVGAFDEIHPNRKQLFLSVENILAFNTNYINEKNSNQISLFAEENKSMSVNLVLQGAEEDYNVEEKMNQELEIVGCFLSGHPLATYQEDLERINILNYTAVLEEQPSFAVLAGYLMKIKVSKSRNGTYFSTLTFYDRASIFNISLFGESYTKIMPTLQESQIYIIDAKIRADTEGVRLFVDKIESITNIKNRKKKNTSSKVTSNILKKSNTSTLKEFSEKEFSGLKNNLQENLSSTNSVSVYSVQKEQTLSEPPFTPDIKTQLEIPPLETQSQETQSQETQSQETLSNNNIEFQEEVFSVFIKVQNLEMLSFVQEIIPYKKGKSTLHISVFNNKKYNIFEITDIAISKSQIDALQSKKIMYYVL